MSQQVREQLSALMDGELARDETVFLLRRCESDRDLPERWSRYHLSRQCLRRQESLALRSDFASSVMAQIELEDAPTQGRGAPWLRWISGGAIAASVAVVALWFSAPQQETGLPGANVASVPAPASTQVPSSAGVPVDFRPPMLSPPLNVQPASATTSGYASSPAPIDPRLQSYLIRHYDAAGGAGQVGMMPYVLLVVPSQPQAASSATYAGETAERR
jgi:sigma-E factor negative regulatory protein RseA